MPAGVADRPVTTLHATDQPLGAKKTATADTLSKLWQDAVVFLRPLDSCSRILLLLLNGIAYGFCMRTARPTRPNESTKIRSVSETDRTENENNRLIRAISTEFVT